MNLSRTIVILLCLIKTLGIQGQEQLRIRLDIELKPIENRNKNLKNYRVIISKGKQEIESFTAKKHKFKKTIKSKGIYKFEFSKESYVSKHFIIDVVDIPKNKKRHRLKAEINLFHESNKYDVSFLDKEPISIAYYDYLNKVLKWDFDYNRTMVEKIIKAQITD